jgi:hypothetical protein
VSRRTTPSPHDLRPLRARRTEEVGEVAGVQGVECARDRCRHGAPARASRRGRAAAVEEAGYAVSRTRAVRRAPARFGAASRRVSWLAGARPRHRRRAQARPARAAAEEHGGAEHAGEAAGARDGAVTGTSLSDGGLRLEVPDDGPAAADGPRRSPSACSASRARSASTTSSRASGCTSCSSAATCPATRTCTPSSAPDGTWRTPLTLAPGTYRAVADFSVDGERRSLAVDLAAPGPLAPKPLPAASTTARGRRPARGAGARTAHAVLHRLPRQRSRRAPSPTSARAATWWPSAPATSPTPTSTRPATTARPPRTRRSCRAGHLPAVPRAADRRAGPPRAVHPGGVMSTLDLPRAGDDLRLLRQPHRAQAQQARGRHGAVNYATEQAAVEYDDAVVTPDDLVKAVEAAGYKAVLPTPRGQARADAAGRARRPDPLAAPPARRVVAAHPAVPCAVRWSRRCSSTTGSGRRCSWPRPWCSGAPWPFHRVAWANARLGTASMDTLVSLGAIVSLGLLRRRPADHRRRRHGLPDALRAARRLARQHARRSTSRSAPL